MFKVHSETTVTLTGKEVQLFREVCEIVRRVYVAVQHEGVKWENSEEPIRPIFEIEAFIGHVFDKVYPIPSEGDDA